ncbi:MAG: hypothetical protein ACRDTZ_23965 [Pseudonocardiaceae bacterium]
MQALTAVSPQRKSQRSPVPVQNHESSGCATLWRYSPLTRTRYKPLTCDFAHRGAHLPPRPNAKRPWSLRECLDEHDTAELITTYRAKAWSMHLIAAAQLWVLRDQE